MDGPGYRGCPEMVGGPSVDPPLPRTAAISHSGWIQPDKYNLISHTHNRLILTSEWQKQLPHATQDDGGLLSLVGIHLGVERHGVHDAFAKILVRHHLVRLESRHPPSRLNFAERQVNDTYLTPRAEVDIKTRRQVPLYIVGNLQKVRDSVFATAP